MVPPGGRERVRILFFFLGSLCVGLAILGIVLPLLPTTPFLLLAGACYARGSERAHRWLLSNRLLGPTLRRWDENRTISIRAKTAAIGLMFIMMAAAAWGSKNGWLALGLFVVFALVSAYLLKIPSPPGSREAGSDAEGEVRHSSRG